MKDSQQKITKKLETKNKAQTDYTDQRIRHMWGMFPLVSLLIILSVLVIYNLSLKQQIAQNSILPGKKLTLPAFPVLTNTLAPDLTAHSAIILDDTAKTVLYEKNPLLRFSMASTTKIMTTIVALEYFKPTDVITVYTVGVEGTTMGFIQGEKIFFEDMLYALMLPSANDAAFALADNYPGGVSAFVARMNAKAAELGLPYTHYVDPAGLDDDKNYTTVRDLARLASYAIRNKSIAEIVGTRQRSITSVDGSQQYTVMNLNKLLGEYGVTGMKTGFTQGAGGVLVTTKQENNHIFIIVVMKSEDRFGDTKKLLRLISTDVKFINPGEYLLEK